MTDVARVLLDPYSIQRAEQRRWHLDLKSLEQLRELLVEFATNGADLRDAETTELRARLIRGEPGVPVVVFPNDGVQGRVEADTLPLMVQPNGRSTRR
jgi:hypothetical protein